jgi:hypothetical protein
MVAIFRTKHKSLLPPTPEETESILKFLRGLQKLEQAKKCLELRGEYVE